MTRPQAKFSLPAVVVAFGSGPPSEISLTQTACGLPFDWPCSASPEGTRSRHSAPHLPMASWDAAGPSIPSTISAVVLVRAVRL